MRNSGFRRIERALLLGSLLAVVNCSTKGVKWAENSAPQVRVNQVGYLVKGPKWATVRLGAGAGVKVHLTRGEDVVWSGTTTVKGYDRASGDEVHLVDFSAYQAPADELRLVVEGSESFPFVVRDDIYGQLTLDALKYFYHNRSGVPIVRPYVDKQEYSRPAGHLSDESVPCLHESDCTYSLDVSGGWYDAGDHGKYVVNGGISAWTLLALYERLLHLSGTAGRWGDRTLNLPESGNGSPDLLDEARFEVEFLLKMQVPEGNPLAGMAHHKVHDHAWTPLGIEPPERTDQRGLHAPSTAATLNLAAVAAQASRLFAKLDPKFSARCLSAARRAYDAATKHPKRFASLLDKHGGGPYADTYVGDEFFWAEAELFVTTGEESFLNSLRQSPHFRAFPTRIGRSYGALDGDEVTTSMTWQSTAALGWISLAVVPSALPKDERARLISGLTAAGDTYLSVIESEGYRQPLGLGPSGKYPWGSNSFILNNMVVLSLAYDLSKERKYAEGVVQGMDYLLGRNPLLQSYVTGYGSVPLMHPHHRFWSHELDPRFPKPPPGAVSGGPNSSLQDPQARKSGLSRSLPPQKCFVDHIEAWSVNEVTINWNAPLAWAALFLDEWRGA